MISYNVFIYFRSKLHAHRGLRKLRKLCLNLFLTNYEIPDILSFNWQYLLLLLLLLLSYI